MPPPEIPDWLYPTVVLRNQDDAFVWVQGCYCTGSGELQYETLDAFVNYDAPDPSTAVVRVTSRRRTRTRGEDQVLEPRAEALVHQEAAL